jgi:hypothetical protein
MNLSNAGWATMTGWTIWMFILPLILEIFQLLSNKNKGKILNLKLNLE